MDGSSSGSCHSSGSLSSLGLPAQPGCLPGPPLSLLFGLQGLPVEGSPRDVAGADAPGPPGPGKVLLLCSRLHGGAPPGGIPPTLRQHLPLHPPQVLQQAGAGCLHLGLHLPLPHPPPLQAVAQLQQLQLHPALHVVLQDALVHCARGRHLVREGALPRGLTAVGGCHTRLHSAKVSGYKTTRATPTH